MMVAQVADICTFVCGYPLQLQAIIISNLLILVRYQLRHFICLFAVVVCVCVCGGGLWAGEHVIADVIGIG